jgi:hypothetical protein
MKFPDFEPCGAKISSAISAGRVPLFFAGRAREVLRKLRNEVLPDERAPMMRMLYTSQHK